MGSDIGSNIAGFSTLSGKLTPQCNQDDRFNVGEAHLVLLGQLNDKSCNFRVAWPVEWPIIQLVAVRVIDPQRCPPLSVPLSAPASSLAVHLVARYSAKDTSFCST